MSLCDGVWAMAQVQVVGRWGFPQPGLYLRQAHARD